MRVVIDTRSGAAPSPGAELTDDELDALYRPPEQLWLRANMVSTVDGAATGEGGLSGGINNAADHRVFSCLRRLADAVLVGAGTARSEQYSPLIKPLVLISHSGQVPPNLRDAEPGLVWMVTCTEAENLSTARDILGADHVLTAGRERVDLARARPMLHARGLRQVLSEGGPHLLAELIAQETLDELDVTTVPRVLGGVHPRITAGAVAGQDLSMRLLLEDNGTLLARWMVARSSS